MKVLIIGNIRRQQGGITTQMLELKDSLLREGYEVAVVSTHGAIAKRAASLFRAFGKALQCDVILGVGCAYYGVIPMVVSSVVSKLSGTPVVYNFHDGQVEEFLRKYQGLLKWFFGKSAIVVATSFLKDSFVRYGFNAEVISNHLNDIEIKELPVRDGKTMIIWARSFEKLYRPEIALEGAKYLLNKFNAEFHFYGGGSLRDYYAGRYRNIPGIVFHDFVKRETLLNEYGKYDIFINTSDFDNFPMSIVEAGLNGLQILTSNPGGIASIYDDSEVNFFKKGDLSDFTEQLEALLANPGFFRYKTKNLAKKIIGFRWESVKNNWVELLNNTAQVKTGAKLSAAAN